MLVLLAAALAGGGGSEAPASGGGAGALGLLLVVSIAYLLAHLVVNRLQRWLLFIAGFEYILLGVVLGPGVVGSNAVFGDLDRLAPMIAFAAGWVALLYGMEFKLRDLLDDDRAHATRIAVVDVAGTGVAVGVGAWLFFQSGTWMPVPAPAEAAAAAAMLACAAAAGSSSAVDLLRDAYPDIPSRLLPTLRQASRFGDLLSVLGLGLVFCVFRSESGGIAFAPTPANWVLATAGLGLGLGVVFGIFFGNEATANNRFLAVVGITVFAAGSSFFLEVSALTVNLLLGAYLVNTVDGPKVAETLETSLRPITLVLMLFAGAMWTPVPLQAGVALAVGYIVVRVVGKATSHFIGSLGTPIRRDLYRGLLAQGDVAIAIAVSFRVVFDGPASQIAFTAVLVSVMFHQLIAPRALKRLLIDAGELDSDAPALTRVTT